MRILLIIPEDGLERMSPLVEEALATRGHIVHTTSKFRETEDDSYDIALAWGGIAPLTEQTLPLATVLFEEHSRDLRVQTGHNVAYVSRWLRRRLIERGSPVQDTPVIRPGIPLDTFPERETPGSLHTPLRLLYAGRISPNRGIENVLEAARLIVEARGPEALRVTFVGECSPDYQAELTRKSSVAVDFAGPVLPDEMPQVYRDHDVLVWPDPSPIPFSLTHLEAMASGLVVISTALGGVVEVMRDGENGFVILPDRPKQLANRISRLVNDPKLAQNLAARARSYVEEHFSIQRFAADLDAFLMQAVARPST